MPLYVVYMHYITMRIQDVMEPGWNLLYYQTR